MRHCLVWQFSLAIEGANKVDVSQKFDDTDLDFRYMNEFDRGGHESNSGRESAKSSLIHWISLRLLKSITLTAALSAHSPTIPR